MFLAMSAAFVCVLTGCELSLFIGNIRMFVVIVDAMKCKMKSMFSFTVGVLLCAI